MAFWDDLWGGIVGRSPKTFDPYEQDREARMNALSQGMADYDRMLSTPGGALPKGMREQLMNESNENIAAANPGAGQSGFLADRQARGRNQIAMGLVEKELSMLDKQRSYNQALLTANQPTQYQPGQTGMLQQAGSDLAGRGVRQLGDQIFGNPEDDTTKKPVGGQTQPKSSGGFGVGLNPKDYSLYGDSSDYNS